MPCSPALADIVVLLLFIGTGLSHLITAPRVEKPGAAFSPETKANLVLLYAQVYTKFSSSLLPVLYKEGL